MERGETNTHVKHWRFRPEPEFFEPPGPLAEHLAPEIALTGLRAFVSRREPAGHLRSAWQHVEYAVNRNREFAPEVHRRYFSDATHVLGKILENSLSKRKGIGEDILLQSLTLSSFLPLFTKRALLQPISGRDCYDVYRSLGVSLKERQQYSSHITWRYAETITFAGSARTGQPELLIWPTSPREEGSKEQPNNHDGYFIRERSKVPVQLKLIETEEEKDYDDGIIKIYLLPILDHACKRAGLADELDFGQSLDYANSAMITEATGGELSDQQLRFLDYFSRSLAARSRYASVAA